MRHLRAQLALAGSTVLLTFLAGCSAGDPDPAAAVDAAADEDLGDEGTASGSDGEATPQDAAVIEVDLVDFGFVGLPQTLDAGTQLRVTNSAESELHELVAFRLEDDDERAVSELTELSQPELLDALGEPATVLLAAPDGPMIPAVGDGTLDEPGRYAIMCFIPTGVDPQEYLAASEEAGEGPPQVDGGPPHFVHGMFAEVTVE